MPLTFNAEVIPDRNDFGVLFDPQFKGKIAMWEDVSTLAQVEALENGRAVLTQPHD